MDIPHVSLIHLSVDGLWVGFLISANTHAAAVNIYVRDFGGLSPQQCTDAPSFSTSCQYVSSPVFGAVAAPVDTKWCLVALVCVFLMTEDAEHLFIFLLATCISSWEKCLMKSFARF